MPKKEKIQEMFDSIAPEYDAFNHLTSLGIDRSWRRRALREITGPRVLDEACGTGDFSIAIAKYNEAWLVTGVDISDGMLEVMSRKVAEQPSDKRRGSRLRSVLGKASNEAAAEQTAGPAALQPRITAEVGDSCALRFADGSFDTVTVAFGVRNFENREKALAEALRVLRPGGRFVMLELGIPENPVVAWGFKFYFTRIMPLIGGRMSRNEAAYRYLPASVLSFPKPKEWTATMRQAGFRNVKHKALSLGICNLFVGEK